MPVASSVGKALGEAEILGGVLQVLGCPKVGERAGEAPQLLPSLPAADTNFEQRGLAAGWRAGFLRREKKIIKKRRFQYCALFRFLGQTQRLLGSRVES